jgi:hypothetical protein
MKILTLCFLMLTSTWAFGGDIRDIERILNLSSVVSGICQDTRCVIIPKRGVSSQEYRDEVAFIKKHLDPMGVELRYKERYKNELSRPAKSKAI